MESQSELVTTLTVTWARSCSTSGARRGRERSSRRGNLSRLLTRWTFMIISCPTCYWIIATGASTCSGSWPRAESRGGGWGAAGERLGGRTGGLALNKFLVFCHYHHHIMDFVIIYWLSSSLVIRTIWLRCVEAVKWAGSQVRTVSLDMIW